MQVIIAEKPSVGREIANVLGFKKSHKGYIELTNGNVVTWAFGHLITLAQPEDYKPEWKNWSLASLPILPEEEYKLEIVKSSADQYKVIKALLKEANEAVVATDAGREGQLIASWILKKSNYKGSVKRLWISSLTAEAIQKGFSQLAPGSNYDNLTAAAEQRAIADWLIGLNATRAYTSKTNTLLTIGRVQTPTLAMIVQREKDITSFQSKPFWELVATFKKDNDSYQGKYYWNDENQHQTRFSNRSEAELKLKDIASETVATIHNIQQKTEVKKQPTFFDLTALQKLANKKINLTADQTLKALQHLYETKFVTYPRTDSSHITKDIAISLPSVLNKLRVSKWGEHIPNNIPSLVDNKRYTNADKVTDHHAILPTGVIPGSLSKDQQGIYDLVVSHFIAAHLPEGKDAKTSVITKVKEIQFLSVGKTILDLGWRILFREDSFDEDQEEKATLPQLSQNEIVQKIESKITEGKTQPPNRYTEATLLTAMETAGKDIEDEDQREIMKQTKGLGTPATRSNIIEGLKTRMYISLSKKNIIPTDKGISLIQVLGDHPLTSPELTGEWENLLKKIEKGEFNAADFQKQIEKLTVEIVQQARNTELTASFESSDPKTNGEVGTCPSCGKGIFTKEKFYGCSGYKDGCRFTLPKLFLKVKLNESSIKKLLKGEEILLTNIPGQYGPYSLFVKHDGKQFDTRKPDVEDLSLGKCPLCKMEVLEKEKFYGCSGYKNGCRFTFPKEFSGKKISSTQLKKLLKSGKTDVIKGFVGKKGSFSTALGYDPETKRLSFVK